MREREGGGRGCKEREREREREVANTMTAAVKVQMDMGDEGILAGQKERRRRRCREFGVAPPGCMNPLGKLSSNLTSDE